MNIKLIGRASSLGKALDCTIFSKIQALHALFFHTLPIYMKTNMTKNLLHTPYGKTH